jgi:anti-sigma factor RsiW
VSLCERVHEYLDGELSDRDAADFASHLAGCAPCTAEAGELGKLHGLLKRVPDGVPRAEAIECVLSRTKMESFFDGELSVADAERVTAHIASCEGCGRELTRLEQLEGLLHRVPAGGAPGKDFARRVADRARPRSSSWRTYVPLSIAAAVLFGFVITRVSPPPYEFEAALRDFASSDALARAKAIAWVQGQGSAVEAPLVASLSDTSVERQRAAGLLIASLDDAARARILGRQVRLPRDWESLDEMGLPYDFDAALRDAAQRGSVARAAEWAESQGGSIDARLLTTLSDPSVTRQKAAGLLIASLPDASRSRILDAQTRPAREWELQDIGGDLTDVELVGYAIQLAKSEKTADEAVRILRKLDKDAVNRAAHDAIVRSLRELFTSGQESSIRAGFRIAERLELLVGDVVEFLDVPELGDRALEFLKKQSGRDFGRDKPAWRGYFESIQL